MAEKSINPPKKILYLVNNCDYFLSHRLALARAAQKEGYEIHIGAPKNASLSKLEGENFIFHEIPFTRKGMNPFLEFLVLIRIFKLLKSLKPDILHNLTIKPMLYGSISAKFIKPKLTINAVTGLGFVFTDHKFSTKLLRWFVVKTYRMSFRLPNHKVIFQNHDDLLLFLNKKIVDQENTIVIKGSGIDLDQFKPMPSLSNQSPLPIIMLASRMLWDKGIGEFYQSAKLLKSKGIQATFALVGDPDPGNPNSIPKTLLEEWNQEGYVQWWGKRSDMQEVLNMATIVCLPSYREGTPRVLLEASACGKPIITTNVPGCREIIVHEINGLLIPEKNAQALADAIERLLMDEKIRKIFGENARKSAEKEFSNELINEKTIGLYSIDLTP